MQTIVPCAFCGTDLLVQNPVARITEEPVEFDAVRTVHTVERCKFASSQRTTDWRKNYLDLADAVCCRESTSVEDACRQARNLRKEIHDLQWQLKYANERISDLIARLYPFK